MNYEDIYQQLQQRGKNVADKLQSEQRLYKSAMKNTESGDLKSLLKDLAAMENALSDHAALIKEMIELSEAFDAREYMENGDFARQLVEYCESNGVDVKGEFPTYEIFPYKVRIDNENQDVYVDRKKVQCLRPLQLAKDLKLGRDKLMKASFNATSFLNELAEAYDVVAARKPHDRNGDYDLQLKDLYRVMVPMQRHRKDYDIQSFAYDLSRLFSSDIEYTKDGRQFQFGGGRNSKNYIRFIDKDGKEQFKSSIRFYMSETGTAN